MIEPKSRKLRLACKMPFYQRLSIYTTFFIENSFENLKFISAILPQSIDIIVIELQSNNTRRKTSEIKETLY